MDSEPPFLDQNGFPAHSPSSNTEPEVPVYSIRPGHEQYELPSEAPFTAEIVIDAHSVTEIDISHAFSSLPVTGIRSPPNTTGQFFVEFSDVQGLKQCLDKYWMFKIRGRHIRTYVASAHRSSLQPMNALSGSPTLNSKSHALLHLTSLLQSPSNRIHFLHSLLVLIHFHLLTNLCKSALEVNTGFDLLYLNNNILTFF
ncbi:hypothetical protein GEMRC1_010136 [Eukaryota sp. GEM-RC1]